MTRTDSQPTECDVVVVGAGFSGLCMAIKLKEAGIDDFLVLEKADDIGGTWRDNIYPGCACDVPSHLYSYSFAPNPRWSRMFAPQQEIWDYLKRTADDYGILPHMRFNTEVLGAHYDNQRHGWHIETGDGQKLFCRVLVSGIGALSIPSYPNLPGLDQFAGTAFHSARWNHDYDLKDKRVAVIGTGASAIQFVPRIAPQVKQLDLYQRTPPWVLSKPDRRMTKLEKLLFKTVPATQKLFRGGIYWWMESRVLGLAVDPRAMKLAELYARHFIRRNIKDRDLRNKVTPDYTIGCKRILMSDEYYPALNRSNVAVLTDGIREVKAHGIVDSNGTERPVDAIIYGTGFKVSDPIGPMKIFGRQGKEIRETWDQSGMEAYLGISVTGFPNFFMLLGPNTGLGHTSIVFMIESQVNYVMQAIRKLRKDKLESLDVKPEVQAGFNRKLQKQLDSAVWSAGGCESWYLDEFGKNRTLWPSFTFQYWMRTRRFEPDKYQLEAS
ncbi:MAG: NAD(P)/FAD-dependent oxidoreductase [Alcanivorax sp.]|nr:NAD(P)/FAD-dependent oxidoreductase [Alcanivorax sp.]